MTDEEIRAVVRQVLAQRAASAPAAEPAPARPVLHVSHATFTLSAGAETDGACVIEPAVSCTHCNYCRSLGH